MLFTSHAIDILLCLTVGTGSKAMELRKRELLSKENSKYWTVPPLQVSLKQKLGRAIYSKYSSVFAHLPPY